MRDCAGTRNMSWIFCLQRVPPAFWRTNRNRLAENVGTRGPARLEAGKRTSKCSVPGPGNTDFKADRYVGALSNAPICIGNLTSGARCTKLKNSCVPRSEGDGFPGAGVCGSNRCLHRRDALGGSGEAIRASVNRLEICPQYGYAAGRKGRSEQCAFVLRMLHAKPEARARRYGG